MTPVGRGDERITDGRRARLLLIVVVLLLGAVVAVGLTPVFDSDVVHDQAGLGKVELGLPVPWLEQDQTGRPQGAGFPQKARLDSALENPTTVKAAGLAIDLAAALALEAVVAGVILLVLRRRNLLD